MLHTLFAQCHYQITEHFPFHREKSSYISHFCITTSLLTFWQIQISGLPEAGLIQKKLKPSVSLHKNTTMLVEIPAFIIWKLKLFKYVDFEMSIIMSVIAWLVEHYYVLFHNRGHNDNHEEGWCWMQLLTRYIDNWSVTGSNWPLWFCPDSGTMCFLWASSSCYLQNYCCFSQLVWN